MSPSLSSVFVAWTREACRVQRTDKIKHTTEHSPPWPDIDDIDEGPLSVTRRGAKAAIAEIAQSQSSESRKEGTRTTRGDSLVIVRLPLTHQHNKMAALTASKPIPLGSSVPALTAHAISVSLPTWEDNIGYEEGDKRVVDRMETGYPRFFIHRSIQKVNQSEHPD